jgi:ABC-type uncharacterized transport system involved in gliding motility auxiliary subunit
MKLGSKTLFAALLLVGLVLVNYLATSIPLRLDATEGRIYTLSPGTRSLLSKIEEPITLDFYFSRSAQGLPVSYKNYAERVQEMLRQYVRGARGRIVLNVVDPRPDTPEEERAAASGLQPQVLPSGEQISFGLVATQADQVRSITSFNPSREAFLEYDLSQLVVSVQQVSKRRLGLLSSLPLKANPQEVMALQQGRRPQSQYVMTEWEKSFEVVRVEQDATELPPGLDLLAVVHPQNLSPRLQYAIDRFLLSGKPVLIAVDPASQYFRRMGGQAGMFGGPQPGVSSDLPLLLKAYGIGYDHSKLVGDPLNAAKVDTGAGVVSYPIWLNLDRAALNSSSIATSQLANLLFIESGSLTPLPGSGLAFTPLVQSSEQAGEIASAMTQFAQPDEIGRQLTGKGRKTLAALVTGTFHTAFPGGEPKDEKAEAKDVKDAKPPMPVLKEGKGTLIVVADTDWLLDDYSVRRFSLLGTSAAEPINDNLYLGSNLLEYLGGSSDLVSIRGKGSSLRPFKVVQQMEADAQRRYQDQLAQVEGKLSDVQRRLSELQGKKGEARSLVSSPEVRKAVEDYQRQESDARRQRREIRRALREDIDRLENILILVNLLFSPLLVVGFGLWFQRSRK